MTSDTSPRPISPLRARMIEDMTVRGFNEHTRRDYVRQVRSFAAFIGHSPHRVAEAGILGVAARGTGPLHHGARPDPLPKRTPSGPTGSASA